MERQALFRIEQASTSAELEKACEHALAAGFDGVEIVGWAAPTRLVGAVGTVGNDQRNIAVAARCIATDIETGLAEVTALLHQAASLGARCLNLTLPPIARNSGPEGFTCYQDALNFAYQLLHRVRYEAEATGVALALEAGCHAHSLGRACLQDDGEHAHEDVTMSPGFLSPVELREIIDAANSWAVGACIDVTRIARIGLPEDWIRTLRARVHAVRVGTVELGGQPVSMPDHRTVNVDAIAAALDEIRYDRPVIAFGHGMPKEIRLQLAKLGCPMANT